jgi:hypothetical protein
MEVSDPADPDLIGIAQLIAIGVEDLVIVIGIAIKTFGDFFESVSPETTL